MSSDLPTRRDLLIGRSALPGGPKAHISSLIVHARQEEVAAVKAALFAMPGVEIPGESAGKLVVTLETDSELDIVACLNEISLLDGVMSAALVFHHFEPEPETAQPSPQG